MQAYFANHTEIPDAALEQITMGACSAGAHVLIMCPMQVLVAYVVSAYREKDADKID